ncbi:urease subunit beta [Oxalobacteraceae bacterium]|nr:urease subunit beta [Oxalobacteraceae bacterium]
MTPGEYLLEEGEIGLNVGRETASVTVHNRGDRPIQVGSHFHFFEVNPALHFERWRAYGMRLNIAAGTAVRFEPGQQRTIELVKLAGEQKVFGFNGAVNGKLQANPPKG